MESDRQIESWIQSRASVLSYGNQYNQMHTAGVGFCLSGSHSLFELFKM